MEFRILGPLEVRAGKRDVPLGGRKQRAVLAILLLHRNEVVSADRLADQLWSGRPPDTAHAAVQVYVSRLRKLLPAGRLLTRAPGYSLRLEADELDARRFEALVAAGRPALARGDAAAAAETLREALALWRGPPLAEFTFEDFAQAEIRRLDELRLVATEDRAEADLRLGRHEELVGELDGLVATHPLRERPLGQLMLALYRSGRQAEALAAYGDTRRRLADELGIEPGEELRRLERAILLHDPAIAAPPPQPQPAATGASSRPAERRLATMLFADLAVPDDDDPDRAAALADQALAVAVREVEAAGGSAQTGVAGAILATFEHSALGEAQVRRALAAAAAIRERLREAFGGESAARIALESGDVVTSTGRGTTGPPVSAAARLVREAEAGEIVVGRRAAALDGGAPPLPASARVAAERRPD